MDGTQHTVLYREQTNMFRPFGLTLFRDTLYLMDFDLSKVMSFHLGPSSMLVDVYEEFVEPVVVVAVRDVPIMPKELPIILFHYSADNSYYSQRIYPLFYYTF